MVSEITKLGELHRAQLTLKDLVKTLRLCVHAVNQIILTFVLYLLVC